MSRLLAGALLGIVAMLPVHASADWLELGEDAGFRYYVDPDTLRGDRVLRTAATLFNARSADQRFQSMRVQIEADCRQERVRVVSRSVHGQPMGAGDALPLPIARSSTWDYTRPGTANDRIRQYICAASEAEMVAAVDRSAAREGRPPARAAGQVPAPAGPVSVLMQRQGGSFTVPVLVNEQVTLRFVVDSGAADVNIPSDVVARLIDTGAISRADFLGQKTYVLGDGSRIVADTFRIRSMRVGNRVVEDVTATVGRVSSPFLLGQSFLRRLKSWSIDNANDALILE